jgi:hypothetical protein
MIYSVAPKECTGELFSKLLEHYRDEPNVTVIVDRRHGERRARGRSSASGEQRRRLRDRRRARVVGELSSIATADG